MTSDFTSSGRTDAVDSELTPAAGADGAHSMPAPLGMTRRALLKRLGVGAGAVVVVAMGGVTWRAIDQGVCAPGTGPAYDPWRADLTSRRPVDLVGAAILAASAHDSQPWAFRVQDSRIDIFADLERSMGAMDPLLREMDVSLGCALENLVLAAEAHGYAPVVSLLPTPGDPTHVAQVDLAPGPAAPSDLHQAIPSRHTNRAAYRTDRGVEPALLNEIAALADVPEASLVWLSTEDAKSRFGQLTIDATAAIIADMEQARDDFAWYRQDWADIQRQRDGITMDAGGMGDIARIAVRLLPSSDQTTMQQGWLDATRDRQVATAAAFGLIAVRDGTSQAHRLQAGRLLQRIHLFATTKSLGLQPLNQIFERADREVDRGLEPTFGRALDELTPERLQSVTAFRIGYPTAVPGLSPRRPIAAVVRA